MLPTKINKRRSGLKGLHKNSLSCCLEIIGVNSHNGKKRIRMGYTKMLTNKEEVFISTVLLPGHSFPFLYLMIHNRKNNYGIQTFIHVILHFMSACTI